MGILLHHLAISRPVSSIKYSTTHILFAETIVVQLKWHGCGGSLCYGGGSKH